MTDAPDVPDLTSRERAKLKARAHHLKPVVRVGHAGVTDAVVDEVDRALAARELIKVQIDDDDRESRRSAAAEIGARTGAALVQQVGKVVVVWRPKPAEDGESGAGAG